MAYMPKKVPNIRRIINNESLSHSKSRKYSFRGGGGGGQLTPPPVFGPERLGL